ELQAAQGIVEKKSTVPILSDILIEAKKESLELLATDLVVGLRGGCEAKVTKPGSVTLSARRLFDIVRLLPDAEVRLKEEEGHWVVLTCQKSPFRIAGLPREDFPPIPDFDAARGLHLDRSALVGMIDKVLFAVPTDEGRIDISGALMILDKKQLTM